MEPKKTGEIRLFGAKILVSQTDSDDIGTLKGGVGTVLYPQERLEDIQESDRKSSEVSTCDDEEEDTSLRLSCGSFSVSRTGEKSGKDQWVSSFPRVDDNIAGSSNNVMHGPVLCPTPLRCWAPNSLVLLDLEKKCLNFEPFQKSGEKGSQDSATDHDAGEGTSRNRGKPYQESNDKGIQNSSSNDINSDENRGKQSAKRKRNNVIGDDKKGSESLKKRKRSTITSHSTTEPVPTIEQVPWLLQIHESENGSPPVFLYRKKLQDSDVRKNQNRIFLTRCEQLMEFLTEEERNSACNTKEGLEFYAVDSWEKSYKLHLGKWGSLQMLVLKSQWYKLVHENNVESGSWAEIWGYRLNGKLRLAVNFRKPAEEPAEARMDGGQYGINDGEN